MITKNKVILCTKVRSKFLSKFEALEYINSVSKAKEVWQRNKTPIVLEEESLESHDVIPVPEEVIGKTEEFTEFCHNNGFECGEYRTGETFDTKLERCFLCEIANHRGFTDLKFYNQYVDKSVDCIIYESPKFYVTSELGALKQGYLMIVPKEHILSVAQLPYTYMKEYQEVCEDIEQILLKAFNGNVVCFMEHGSGPSGITSHKKSIVHAHTHVVVDFTLKLEFKEMVKLIPCKDISKAKENHYFSYQEGARGQLMISKDPRVYVQRQFPRQVMADQLGLAPDQYNWRLYDFNENVEATLFHLYKSLILEKEGRIFNRTRGFVEGYPLRKKRRE